MTNTNCLENIQCPKCGNEDSFRIAAKTIATVCDDGVEDHSEMEWDDDSYADCTKCCWHGTLKDFSSRVSVPDSSPVPATALPVRFDDYEVHGVYEFSDDGRTFCEQVPDDEAGFWSLYGHIPGQGLECIGDFRTREHAEEVYARITGRRYGRP